MMMMAGWGWGGAHMCDDDADGWGGRRGERLDLPIFMHDDGMVDSSKGRREGQLCIDVNDI